MAEHIDYSQSDINPLRPMMILNLTELKLGNYCTRSKTRATLQRERSIDKGQRTLFDIPDWDRFSTQLYCSLIYYYSRTSEDHNYYSNLKSLDF